MTFIGWLREQTGRDDPIGDLAKDWFRDHSRPRGSVSPEMKGSEIVGRLVERARPLPISVAREDERIGDCRLVNHINKQNDYAGGGERSAGAGP